jgi:hypothetical protein
MKYITRFLFPPGRQIYVGNVVLPFRSLENCEICPRKRFTDVTPNTDYPLISDYPLSRLFGSRKDLEIFFMRCEKKALVTKRIGDAV